MRWGILGCGKIAGKFAGDLKHAEKQTLAAVGSRSQDRAEQFCGEHGGRGLAGYEQLLADDEVEAVYVSLPNSLHHEWSIRALEAGKHVLCEKPLATSAAEAEAMFAAARKHDRLLVEAFMYRCHPAIESLLEQVHNGAIGQVRLIRSHFTFQREASAADVRYQSELHGGSLMDVGCYPINFARAIVGSEPTEASVYLNRHALGVDQYAAGMLNFDGVLAVFTCGMTVQADRTTFIGGSEGYLRIEDPWFSQGEYHIVRPDGVESRNLPSDKGLYALEAERFAAAVDGQPPWITPDDSLGNMRVLDMLRAE